MIYENSKILLAHSFAEPGIPHLVTVQLVSFSEVQYFALIPVEFHSVVFSPVLKHGASPLIMCQGPSNAGWCFCLKQDCLIVLKEGIVLLLSIFSLPPLLPLLPKPSSNSSSVAVLEETKVAPHIPALWDHTSQSVFSPPSC